MMTTTTTKRPAYWIDYGDHHERRIDGTDDPMVAAMTAWFCAEAGVPFDASLPIATPTYVWEAVTTRAVPGFPAGYVIACATTRDYLDRLLHGDRREPGIYHFEPQLRGHVAIR